MSRGQGRSRSEAQFFIIFLLHLGPLGSNQGTFWRAPRSEAPPTNQAQRRPRGPRAQREASEGPEGGPPNCLTALHSRDGRQHGEHSNFRILKFARMD